MSGFLLRRIFRDEEYATSISPFSTTGLPMTEIPDRTIKDVIREFPALEQVLSEFSIGCTGCSLGTCRLKDIVEIHNLSPDQEQLLMTRIAEIVYPGKEKAIPFIARKAKQKSNDTALCPPLRELVHEHTQIKRVLALLPDLLKRPDLPAEQRNDMAAACIDFIRDYADAFHHAKEEKILFSFFDANSDIIASFLREHDAGRSHIRAARQALAKGDSKTVSEHLTAYAELLTEHIKKEDEILYPWMNRSLSDNQVGRLFSDFASVNNQYSEKAKTHAAFIARMEQPFATYRESVPAQ
jgi:hemerythrin-like domain-containing protein